MQISLLGLNEGRLQGSCKSKPRSVSWAPCLWHSACASSLPLRCPRFGSLDVDRIPCTVPLALIFMSGKGLFCCILNSPPAEKRNLDFTNTSQESCVHGHSLYLIVCCWQQLYTEMKTLVAFPLLNPQCTSPLLAVKLEKLIVFSLIQTKISTLNDISNQEPIREQDHLS